MWIPVAQNLGRHPKTRKLARELGQHPRYAVGLLHEVWDWCIEGKPDGMLAEVPHETIQSVFGFRNGKLLEVLGAAGFLCGPACAGRTGDHRPGRLHDWDEWSGKLVESRTKDRLRKEHTRSGHSRPLDNCPTCQKSSGGQGTGTSTKPASGATVSGGRPADSRTLSDRRGEESRGEENRTPSPRSVDRTGPRPPAEQAPQVTYPLEGAAREERLAELLVPLATAPDDESRQMLEELAVRMTTTNFLTFFQKARLERTTIGAVVRLPNGFVRDFVQRKFTELVAQVLELPTGAVLYLLEGEAVSPPGSPVEARVEAAAEGGGGVPTRTEGPREQEAPSPREREFRAGSGSSGEAAGA